MKLDINEVYHNYIIKVVIFSIFLFKRQIRNPNIFTLSVIAYSKKRLPWKIDLKIDTGLKLDKEEERDIILDEILNNIESDYLSIITISFKTPLKQITMEIDIKDEKKYEKFIYG